MQHFDVMLEIHGAGHSSVVLVWTAGPWSPSPLTKQHRPKTHSKVLGIHAVEVMERSNQAEVVQQHLQGGLEKGSIVFWAQGGLTCRRGGNRGSAHDRNKYIPKHFTLDGTPHCSQPCVTLEKIPSVATEWTEATAKTRKGGELAPKVLLSLLWAKLLPSQPLAGSPEELSSPLLHVLQLSGWTLLPILPGKVGQ